MNRRLGLMALTALLSFAGTALGQSQLDHPVGQMLPYVHDTGFSDNPTAKLDLAQAFEVHMNNAAWIRLYFDEISLPEGGFVRLTSVLDGETQTLDAEALDMWSNTSAYFNGDTVIVEVIAGPGAVGTRIKVKEIGVELGAITIGDPGQCGICGADNRFQTNELWSGRLMPVGCTGSLYCNGDGMITAGHCVSGGSANVMQFNVPNSTAGCATVAPPVNDQFPVLAGFQFQNAGEGADWAACRVGVNGLGQTPFQRYGVFRPLAAAPSAVNAPTNMWGYGLDTNCVRSQTQQNSAGNITQLVGSTHYFFNNDVRGGNSGSGYLNANNQIIAVVTHCRVNCPNSGTRIDLPAFVAARNSVGCGAPPVPGNDACTSAFTIGLGTTNGTTVSATADGANTCGSSSTTADVWYAFTPLCGGTYRFATCGTGTNYDTVLSVHSGCPGTVANTLVCNDDFCATSTTTNRGSQVDVVLAAGTRYLIRVSGFNGAVGNFLLTSSAVALNGPPANNACAAATPIGLGAIDGTTYCATDDGDNNCGFGSTSTADVWYSFTPSCGGTYTFDTCAAANYDTVLSLHTGCPGNVTNLIACNDDACAGLSSRISAVLTAGTNYRVRVSGYFGAQGNFTLTATRGADTFPANDLCADAIPVGPGSYAGSTSCASNDGSANCAASATSPDVWYAYASQCGGHVVIDTVGSNYDTALSVHSGCPGTTANQIACDDDGAGFPISRIVLLTQPGVTYYIRVNGFNNSTGSYRLNINALPNDSCATPMPIGDGATPFSNVGATTDGFPMQDCTNQMGSDLWYRYIGTCDGVTRVTTCGSANFDSYLAVYDSSFACGIASEPVACNDDTCGLQAELEFNSTAGAVYMIRVGGFATRQGCGVVNITCTPPGTVCPPCAADFNDDGGVDGADVGAFFDVWEAGEACGDVNDDGGIDGADVDFFFSVWEQGGCG